MSKVVYIGAFLDVESQLGPDGKPVAAPQVATRQAPKDIAVGKQYNILGTEVAFYMPPTGISVMPEREEGGKPIFVRDAETLEQLDYAILVDEDGNKRYPRGPAVVFTQQKAEIDAKTAVVRAQGEAESIRIRGEALAKNPSLVQLQLIEKWDGKAPLYVGGGASGANAILPVQK